MGLQGIEFPSRPREGFVPGVGAMFKEKSDLREAVVEFPEKCGAQG